MAEAIAPDEQHNFETFRDCFSEPVLKALAKPIDKPKKKKRFPRKSKDGRNGVVKMEGKAETRQGVHLEEEQTSAEDLGEFIDVGFISTLSKNRNDKPSSTCQASSSPPSRPTSAHSPTLSTAIRPSSRTATQHPSPHPPKHS
jgi:hypothetical protein